MQMIHNVLELLPTMSSSHDLNYRFRPMGIMIHMLLGRTVVSIYPKAPLDTQPTASKPHL